jgi:hypothetical protein
MCLLPINILTSSRGAAEARIISRRPIINLHIGSSVTKKAIKKPRQQRGSYRGTRGGIMKKQLYNLYQTNIARTLPDNYF